MFKADYPTSPSAQSPACEATAKEATKKSNKKVNDLLVLRLFLSSISYNITNNWSKIPEFTEYYTNADNANALLFLFFGLLQSYVGALHTHGIVIAVRIIH